LRKFFIIGACGAILVAALAKPGIADSLLSSNYLPHRYCYLAQPGLVWTNVATDGLIAAAYASIFACLMWAATELRAVSTVRGYLWIFIAFGSFILACGGTHAMEIVTVWWPVYPLSAAVKVVCAAVSVPTAVLFARSTPALVANMRRYFEMLSTTRQEKEQAMRALVAAEKLAVAGLISATISHEIKGPLQTAGDLLYLLSDERRIPADVAEKLAILTAELRRASAIANNTLSLFGTTSALEPILLPELVEGVLDLQRQDLHRRGIAIEARLRAPLPARAYSGELRQILINLIQNAAAAIGSGGRILVRAQLRHSPRASSSEAGPANRIENGIGIRAVRPQSGRPQLGYSLTIADDGPGIEPKHRASLFTLFFTTKGEKGTGLGLWLVRSMVEKLGGRIRFRSRTAAECSRPGTVFNLWIPLDPAPITAPSEPEIVRHLADDMALSSKG
jgi:signal transduction histidine kinase